jgi:nitroimidazol reductase NimA-like FMN-containing flavoprotein (pyridoxamine 5'-phosphate oxidase superfamily)
VHAILDEGLVAHVGIVQDGQPFVVPMVYARDGERLLLHGSPASRLLRTLAGGAPVSVNVTLLDALVLARSTFHHSMNYRSVTVLGNAVEVAERAEKLAALERIVEHVVPGRSADARGPSEKELAGTLVVALALDECSAKIRTGPPRDDAEDLELDVWAGNLPLVQRFGPPEPAPDLRPGPTAPGYVTGYARPGAAR